MVRVRVGVRVRARVGVSVRVWVSLTLTLTLTGRLTHLVDALEQAALTKSDLRADVQRLEKEARSLATGKALHRDAAQAWKASAFHLCVALHLQSQAYLRSSHSTTTSSVHTYILLLSDPLLWSSIVFRFLLAMK